MNGSHEIGNKARVVAAALFLSAGAAACGGAATARPSTPVRFHETSIDVDSLCQDADPYTAGEYIGEVGPDLISPIGAQQSNGNYKFENENGLDETEAANSKLVKVLPDNTAGLATISVILSSEKGFTVSEVQTQANSVMGQMEKHRKDRNIVCEAVMHRVLDDGFIRLWQSPADVAEYYPVYSSETKKFNQVGATSAPDTKPVELYGIRPLSESDALGTAISQEWGILADGTVIEESEEQGTYRISPNSSPFDIEHTGPKVTTSTTNPNHNSGTTPSNSKVLSPQGPSKGKVGSALNGTNPEGTKCKVDVICTPGAPSGPTGPTGPTGPGSTTTEVGPTTTTTKPKVPSTTTTTEVAPTTTTSTTTTTTSPIQKNPEPTTTVPPCDDPFNPACHS